MPVVDYLSIMITNWRIFDGYVLYIWKAAPYSEDIIILRYVAARWWAFHDILASIMIHEPRDAIFMIFFIFDKTRRIWNHGLFLDFYDTCGTYLRFLLRPTLSAGFVPVWFLWDITRNWREGLLCCWFVLLVRSLSRGKCYREMGRQFSLVLWASDANQI